jgi:hypothetical protein
MPASADGDLRVDVRAPRSRMSAPRGMERRRLYKDSIFFLGLPYFGRGDFGLTAILFVTVN